MGDIMEQKNYLGVEIGGTKLQLIVMDENGAVIESKRFAIAARDGASAIRRNIESQVREWQQKYQWVAIGVGFGGPVNWHTGQISLSQQVQGWNDFNFKEWLEGLTNATVYVDNDANVAALGEATYGAAKNYHVSFYITLGSGVGGGVVINGDIYHATFPGEVEVGHLRLDKTGTTLESLCSGWAIDTKIRNLVQQNPESILFNLCKGVEQGEARFLKQAMDGNDMLAMKIYNEWVDDLAYALSHVVHLFHPGIIVIGGGLSLIGEMLIDSIQERLCNYLMEAFLPGPGVARAVLQEQVVPIGAIVMAQRRMQTVLH